MSVNPSVYVKNVKIKSANKICAIGVMITIFVNKFINVMGLLIKDGKPSEKGGNAMNFLIIFMLMWVAVIPFTLQDCCNGGDNCMKGASWEEDNSCYNDECRHYSKRYYFKCKKSDCVPDDRSRSIPKRMKLCCGFKPFDISSL